MSYERLIFNGYIGDAELLKSKAQHDYLKLKVAADRMIGGENKVIWYNVLMFGAMVRDKERLLQWYRKGRPVLIEGRPQFEPYLRNDGTLAIDYTVIATSMPELLDLPLKHNAGRK